jgi:hypothetical protein
MSRERQRERQTTDDLDVELGDDDERSDSRTGGSRMTVGSRTSWSGLAKRTYNVVLGGQSRRQRDSGGALKLAGLMILGSFVTGLFPLPLTWLVGIAAGAAAGGWAEEGSSLLAVGNGAVIAFIGGLAFATAFFGLGFLFTILLTVVGAVLGGIGYLAGEQ